MYDVIVVGAGHAGCEAAHICGQLGKKTLLITSNLKNVADMACNPSIGGSAKGIIVREIDALNGLMGKVTDRSLIQLKMLNNKKGPAVRALRAQIDKEIYSEVMLKFLKNTNLLTLKEGMVEDLIINDNKIEGIILENNEQITSGQKITMKFQDKDCIFSIDEFGTTNFNCDDYQDHPVN